jgi:ATP-dependent Lon protease
VMRESAQAALSFVRAHIDELNPDLPDDFFQTHDLHIHVPAGAIPKDGPSAGVTMATALASLISRRPVRKDTAMTGELTLIGQVLPIGGLKEKALAAQAAGIQRVIAPKLNEQDIEEIPEHLRKELEFVWVEGIEEVLEEALVPEKKTGAKRAVAKRGAAKDDGADRDGAGPDGAKPGRARPARTRAGKATARGGKNTRSSRRARRR